jgi:Secretion system C-terminal sorting domain
MNLKIVALLIIVLGLSSTHSLFAQCNGDCDALTPIEIPKFFDKSLCFNKSKTYYGDFTIEDGGEISIFDGVTLTIIGSLTVKDGGFINLCQSSYLRIDGDFVNESPNLVINGFAHDCNYHFWVNNEIHPEEIFCISPMPLNIVDFNIETNSNLVDIYWTSLSEFNSKNYTIERSTNGLIWETIETVSSAGNSNQVINYYATDFNPINGIAYYRLYETNNNGEKEYSDILSTQYNDNSLINIFPNPASNKFYIQNMNNDIQEIQIISSLGQVVKTISETEDINIEIDVSTLTNGLYIVSTFGINGKKSRSIVINN